MGQEPDPLRFTINMINLQKSEGSESREGDVSVSGLLSVNLTHLKRVG